MLRRGRRARSAAVPSGQAVRAAFTALFAPATDGRYEAVAGSNILTDQVNGARTFAVGAGVVANAAADADYAGKASLILSGTQYLQSNQAASFWPSLHNGAGTIILVHKITAADGTDRYVLTTSDASTTQVGFCHLSRGPAANITGLYVCNNVGGGYALAADPFGATVFTASYLDFSVGSGANGVVIRRKSATVATGTLTSPSAADPARTLRIGAAGAATGQLTVRALYHWRRVLTVAERAVVQAYILADSGLTP